MKKSGTPIKTELDRFVADCLPEFRDAIQRGSLSFLSVANGSLLAEIAAQPGRVFDGFGTAAASYYEKYPELRDIKNAFFEYTLQRAANGEAGLLPHLAKGITSRKQLDRYLQLLNGASASLRQTPPAITKLLVYPGTFDPMHYGHRLMIASLLDKVGTGASLAINVNNYQARKNNLEETYERRMADMEYKLLKSDILDPYQVCVMDFRFGAREDEDHLRQTRMQAFMAGDQRLHWVIGGDKFLSEVERGQAEEAAGIPGRTLSRFNLDSMSIYIVPRKGQDVALFRELVAGHDAKYAAEFVLAEEKAYDGTPISATLIRTYRDHTDAELRREAERMEKVDLKRDYRVQLQPKRLAAFDYDGTITQPHGASVSGAVRRGVASLWRAGVMTTVLTARPYQRLVGVSGGIETVVSPQAPLATERGARIVDAAKQSNYKYYPLGDYELDIVDAIPKQAVDFIGFYPEELHGMSFIWTPNPAKQADITARFGHDAHILPSDPAALQAALHQAKPCLVTVRFTTEDPANKVLFPKGLNVAWSHKTVSIIMAGIDKLSALNDLHEATGSTLSTTIYAGNDSNDLPVLSHPELQERIFVGEQPVAGIAEPFTLVPTPDALGEYLAQLAKENT